MTRVVKPVWSNKKSIKNVHAARPIGTTGTNITDNFSPDGKALMVKDLMVGKVLNVCFLDCILIQRHLMLLLGKRCTCIWEFPL